MKRRTLLAGLGAASLARPALVRAASATTLKLIPQVDLSFLDPHWTTAYVTRNHGYMVFDTLYGQDGSFTPQPQMVEGHTIEDDGKLWTLTLRPGLMWHDGTPVLSRDCAASIRRWAKRDAMGDALMAATDELSTPDDRTLRFRLKHPFPLLPAALGKAASPMPAMMPERLANTDAFTQITEMVGSGPFRFVASERVLGARNVYEKNDKYVPRQDGTVSWTAGPKIVHFDRVEWTTIPDAATAASALQAGEQDWLEYPALDLLDLLKKNRSIRVTLPDPTGLVEMMRPNHLQPPFNNPAIRRAVLHAIDQAQFMQAITPDPALSHTPLGFFGPGTPMASDAGLAPLKPPIDLDRAKAELKAAGYKGERVVLLVPTDYVTLKAMADVASRHDEEHRHERRLRGDRLGHDAAAAQQQAAGGGGRLVVFRHGMGRAGLEHPRRPHRAAWQWRGGVARLVERRQDGGDAAGLANGDRRDQTEGDLRGHPARGDGPGALLPARPIHAADGLSDPVEWSERWICHVLEYRAGELSEATRSPSFSRKPLSSPSPVKNERGRRK